MKTSYTVSRVNDSDLYFAVSVILLGFDKFGYGIFAFLLGMLCVLCKGVVEGYERKQKENSK